MSFNSSRLRIGFVLLLAALTTFVGFAQEDHNIVLQVRADRIENGWYGWRIPVTQSKLPELKIIRENWSLIPEKPALNATANLQSSPVKKMAVERGQNFLILQIPVVRQGSNQNQFEQLQEMEIEIKSSANNVLLFNQEAKTTIADAVLSQGSFFKIAVTQRGLQRIDYNFLKNNLGIQPENFSSANLRVYGNGGVVMDENNAASYPADLVENPILMADGGDGFMNAGDYFIFYSPGPLGWRYDADKKSFHRVVNYYEDSSYYFLTYDHGAGKRVQTAAPVTNPTITVSDYAAYDLHELDQYNLGKFGKTWVGNEMSTDIGRVSGYNISFNTEGILDSLLIQIELACASEQSGNNIDVRLNNTSIWSPVLGQLPGETVGVTASFNEKIPFTASTASLDLQFYTAAQAARAYVDYIQLNYKRALQLYNGETIFRNPHIVGAGAVAKYIVSNANPQTQVWDITNPLEPFKLNGQLSGSSYQFNQVAGTLREFVAFDGSQLHTPYAKGPVGNSNLHAAPFADYLIITHPDFLPAADRLANFHRNTSNLRVQVARTTDIYNEFGSGSKDIGAIRNFIKMFYDRAGTDTADMPKYVLLFGDASYDYKNRVNGNTNKVPTHEAKESYYVNGTYCTDDYYTYLDNHENIEDYNIMSLADVGIGRLPVVTIDEANDVVDKIIRYKSPQSLGKWRLSATILADNEDYAGNHLQDGEATADVVEISSPVFTANKIYLDNIPFVNTPGGDRCPQASQMLTDAVSRGTFMINYTGHGNPGALAHERVLTQDIFESWKNEYRLPFMITATCDFSQYDRPDRRSAGEQLILKRDGGAIAMLTTSHAVYASASGPINTRFLKEQFEHNNNDWKSYGDAMRISKNEGFIANPNYQFYLNTHKFTLLGDPALTPNFPRYTAVTDSILDKSSGTATATDTLKALGAYTIHGSIRGDQQEILSNFNGMVDVVIYDKAKVYNITTKVRKLNETYKVRENIIYKGKVTVSAGKFIFSFIAPKDIDYNLGHGKLVYYAENGMVDAAGADTSLKIGGFSSYPISDDDGPKVQVYIGDSLFVQGSITGSNTSLYAQLSDESGINVSGSSIGHDLVAVLDGNENNPYLLNDYYETETNTYKRGFVKFPLLGLSSGIHELKVRAWDVNNNSGEGSVLFRVVNGTVAELGKLINYPNPMTSDTRFLFEHNFSGEEIEVTIRIFNTTGATVRTIIQKITPDNSRSQIYWDGRADNGSNLGSGVYPYALEIKNADGLKTTSYQKLIITR